jgi:GNAT superfamily N-acetyltransferase
MANPGTFTLADGAQVTFREVGGADREALLAGFERFSPQSRLQRFFTAMPNLPSGYLEHLTDIDQHRHVALGVFDPSQPSDVDSVEGLGVAVGRYFVSPEDPTAAEAALAVIDDYQGRGIGTLLLQSLVVIAHQRGVERFVAYVLAENSGMAALLTDLGAVAAPNPHDARELVFEFDLTEAADALKSTAGYRVMRELARNRD